MENLVCITAYCPTEEQEKILERCVDSVLSSDYHVALISHTHIPLHIQKKCDYYFYDYLNDVTDDIDVLGTQFFQSGNLRINSRFFNKTFYGFAIYRMFSIASQIAINFGYKNIHHIEYDCELKDKNLILENADLLKNFDSIIYTSTGQEDGFLFGSFKSLKVESLPNGFKNFNRDLIYKKMRDLGQKNLEVMTKEMLINSGRVLFGPEPSEERFKRGPKFYNKNVHYTLFYNSEDKTLNIFYRALQNSDEEIFVIINKSKIIRLEVKPNHWYTRCLGVFQEINHIRIDNSKSVIYEKTFDEKERSHIKENTSIVLNEENN